MTCWVVRLFSNCFSIGFDFVFTCFKKNVCLCLDFLIVFKLFLNWVVFGLFLVSFGLLLVLFDCFWLLVAWVLCVVLCCVRMLKFVLVCFSLSLYVLDCFSVSKLFSLPQVVSGFWKFFFWLSELCGMV